MSVRFARAACATLAFAALAAAPAVAETIAITNARIETAAAAGAVQNGTIVMRDGRIAAVGANVQLPAGARVIDAQGGVVTPGLIAPATNITTGEVNLIRETRDDASGTVLSAGFDVQYGINASSTHIRIARQSGVTQAVITPLVGRLDLGSDEDHDRAALQGAGDGAFRDPAMFSGQAAIVRLDDDNPDPLVKARVAVALDFGEAGASHAGGSRGAAIVLIKSALQDARHFSANRAAFDRGETRGYGLSRVDLEALVPVAQGRTPLLVRASRASDIRQTLKLAQEERIRVILEGAEEAWRLAPEIAGAGIPVILDPQADLPSSFETLASRLDNAARLHAAGVLIAIKGTRNFNSLRPIRLNAGTAVAYGLPYAAALQAVTINVARMWGIAERSGSLEAGKDADVVLWSGDPLETTSFPVAVFVRGVEQPGTSRRLELRDRYLSPDNGYPRAYH